MRRAALAAMLSLAAATALTAARPAAAELDATGTRLSVNGGPTRFYMSYGFPNDPEFYAPITQELRRQQVTVEARAETLVVFHKGVKVAEWFLVRDRNNIPETTDPFVLQWGGQTFLPVKAVCDLVSLDVQWDRRGNMVALVPGAPKPKVPVAVKPGPRNPGVSDGNSRRLATLTGVQLEQRGGRLVLKITSRGTVAPSAPFVVNAAPRRLVFDFPNCKWADGLQPPAGSGDVEEIRVGHPTPTTARVALVVPARDVVVTQVDVKSGEVAASLGRGQLARANTLDPVLEAVLVRSQKFPVKRDRHLAAQPIGNLIDENGNIVTPQLEPLRPGGPSVIPSVPEGPSTLPGGPGAEFPTPGEYRPATSLVGKRIVVDAGHGGHHIGASGLNHTEKELTLLMARELEASLKAKGATVIMTRTAEVFVSLDERCQICNNAGADIFISIHCNSMPRRNMQSGSESYWYSSQKSQKLARALHPQLVGAVQGRDGGIRRASFQVIRETNIPSVLLEIGYINNTQDEILLADAGFHRRLAEKLTNGVLNYFGKEVSSNSNGQ